MAYGKNKGLNKGGKKGQKKKQLDPFQKKIWYDITAPSYFTNVRVGKTCVTKTQGTKIETDGLKGRVAEFNLADLQGSEDGHKKVKLEVQECQGKRCLTEFHGMSLSRDKMCQMIKKKHSLVDVIADCKTNDGYVARVSLIAFTKVAPGQKAVFTYAQASQIKKLRRKIIQTMQAITGAGGLKDLVKNLISDKIESDVKTACNRIYPLEPVHVHKVKLVKKPKFDITRLYEVHDKSASDEGAAVADDEAPEAENLLTAAQKE